MSLRNSVSRPSTTTQVLLAVFRAAADMLRSFLTPGWIGSPEHLDLLDDERREEQVLDRALRIRYPDAAFRFAEFKRRAEEHGVRFSPRMAPHHVAAFLDYFDDPAAVRVSPIEALNFQAIDHDSAFNGSMTHPVNRARFLLLVRHAQATGWNDEYFSPERAAWTDAKWLDHERVERDRMARAGALSLCSGRPVSLSAGDYTRSRSRRVRHKL